MNHVLTKSIFQLSLKELIFLLLYQVLHINTTSQTSGIGHNHLQCQRKSRLELGGNSTWNPGHAI